MDQAKEASRKLRMLRQTGLVHHYTAEFQRITVRLQYDEVAMIKSYYFGLKHFIKHKLSKREDEPESLGGLSEAAVTPQQGTNVRQSQKKAAERLTKTVDQLESPNKEVIPNGKGFWSAWTARTATDHVSKC